MYWTVLIYRPTHSFIDGEVRPKEIAGIYSAAHCSWCKPFKRSVSIFWLIVFFFFILAYCFKILCTLKRERVRLILKHILWQVGCPHNGLVHKGGVAKGVKWAGKGQPVIPQQALEWSCCIRSFGGWQNPKSKTQTKEKSTLFFLFLLCPPRTVYSFMFRSLNILLPSRKRNKILSVSLQK